jgi:hypothetical protein
MTEAYEGALTELHDTGQPQIAPEVIAERIVAAASLGERDPIRLREAALCCRSFLRGSHVKLLRKMSVLSAASAFEILNCTLMLLCCFKRREGAEISAPSRAWIGLPRIEAILA